VSRFTVTVRMADPDVPSESIPCDAVHVDPDGNLYVQVKHGALEQTVARVQHGHWAGYQLELADGPDVDAWLHEGVMTREQFLARVKGEFGDCCAEAPVKAEALPEVGSIVHVVTLADTPTCLPMRVNAHSSSCPGALLLGSTDRALLLAAVPDWGDYESLTHDESRTESGSWHYADHGDGQDVEAEPEKPAPVTVTINVSGSVLSERDLRDTIRKIFTDDARRAWTPGVTIRR
jgi:hypothetical protein